MSVPSTLYVPTNENIKVTVGYILKVIKHHGENDDYTNLCQILNSLDTIKISKDSELSIYEPHFLQIRELVGNLKKTYSEMREDSRYNEYKKNLLDYANLLQATHDEICKE